MYNYINKLANTLTYESGVNNDKRTNEEIWGIY